MPNSININIPDSKLIDEGGASLIFCFDIQNYFHQLLLSFLVELTLTTDG
jgi:hypothetical protein